MNRDLSPAAWVAPGIASLALSIILSDAGSDPLVLDQLISNYSPLYDGPPIQTNGTVNLSNGFNAVSVIDATNARVWLLILPRGNTTTVTLKGITGDTGLAQNPNGFILLTFPATGAPTSVGLTCGGAITGARLIVL